LGKIYESSTFQCMYVSVERRFRSNSIRGGRLSFSFQWPLDLGCAAKEAEDG